MRYKRHVLLALILCSEVVLADLTDDIETPETTPVVKEQEAPKPSPIKQDALEPVPLKKSTETKSTYEKGKGASCLFEEERIKLT